MAIAGFFRNLVQLRSLIASLFRRYKEIFIKMLKVIFYSLRLTLLSVNYIAALVIIPAAIFLIAFWITGDYLIPAIVSIIAVAVYLIIMSNYFSKGVHKFGSNARQLKQMYHTIRMEHKLALHSLKEDPASGRLLVFSAFFIIIEFILFYILHARFGMHDTIWKAVLLLISLQIVFVLAEYLASGYRLFHGFGLKKPPFTGKKKFEKPLPKNYKKDDGFDDLIVAGEEE